MQTRKLVAELLGTAILVFFAVGVATLSLGFKFAGSSTSAGIVATALAFGLVLLALVYAGGAGYLWGRRQAARRPAPVASSATPAGLARS